MIGPELQTAIYGALLAANICDGRIYDQVPPEKDRAAGSGASFPYVTIGDEQVIDDGNTCGESWDVMADIHCWSRPASGSKVEVKTLRATIVAALNTNLSLTGFVVVSAKLETARSLRDPDGKTEHDVITMRYQIDPA